MLARTPGGRDCWPSARPSWPFNPRTSRLAAQGSREGRASPSRRPGWLRRRAARPPGRRAVRHERRPASRRRRAQGGARAGSPRSRRSDPAAAAAVSEFGARRRARPKALRRRRQGVPGQPRLRRRHAAHALPAVRQRRLGSRSWPPSTTPTSRCRPPSPSTASAYKAPVGVHFRGASSYFMVPEGRKRSLNVSLDFVDAKQELGGYKTLNLLNANGDPTFLRAVLYTEIASHYIPTPKMNYMRVVINGESWGDLPERAAVQQGLHARLLRLHEGRALEGAGQPRRPRRPGLPRRARRGLQAALRDQEQGRPAQLGGPDQADRRSCNETPPDKLEAALAPILDVDGALKFLALDVALVNSDGYWTRASDYNIYQDEKGRFHILPHDVNEGARGAGRGRQARRVPAAGLRLPGERPRASPGRGGPPPAIPAGPGMGPAGGGGFGGPVAAARTSIRWSASTTRTRRCARSCSRCRRSAPGTWATCATSPNAGWTGRPWARSRRSTAALIGEDVRADTRKMYSSEAFDSGLEGLKTFVDARRAYLLKVTGESEWPHQRHVIHESRSATRESLIGESLQSLNPGHDSRI